MTTVITKDSVVLAWNQRFGIETVLGSDPPEAIKLDSELLDLGAGLLSVAEMRKEIKFRPQDVEPLLEQASTLLGAAADERRQWHALGEKYAAMKLEIFEFDEMDRVLEREIAAGKFRVEREVKAAELKSVDERVQSAEDAVQICRDVEALISGTNGTGMDVRASLLGRLRAEYSGAEATKPVAVSLVGADGRPYTGTRQEVDGILSEEVAKTDRTVQMNTIRAQLAQMLIESRTARATQQGATTAARWATANETFLFDRAEVTRRTMDAKKTLASMGLLLDFAAQMRSARRRFQELFVDAHRRLEAVSKGLADFYGYPFPVKLADNLPQLEPKAVTFDEVLAWASRAESWLAAFTRRSHSYIVSVSVAHLLGRRNLGDKKEGQWQFTIPRDRFHPNESHIRLRGIAAWIVDSNDIWNIDIAPPSQASMDYEDGRRGVGIEQSCPSFRIGRVRRRVDASMAEVFGSSAAYNLSPLGQWELKCSPCFDSKADINDIELDLYVTSVPR